MLATRKRKSVARITKNSKFFKTIVNAIQGKKGENIVSIDLRKIPEAVADFFIICEAGSPNQVKAIANSLTADVESHCGELPYKHEGEQALQWVIIDYVNVVIHIMLPESRRFYKLEELWSDAPQEEHAG